MIVIETLGSLFIFIYFIVVLPFQLIDNASEDSLLEQRCNAAKTMSQVKKVSGGLPESGHRRMGKELGKNK